MISTLYDCRKESLRGNEIENNTETCNGYSPYECNANGESVTDDDNMDRRVKAMMVIWR